MLTKISKFEHDIYYLEKAVFRREIGEITQFEHQNSAGTAVLWHGRFHSKRYRISRFLIRIAQIESSLPPIPRYQTGDSWFETVHPLSAVGVRHSNKREFKFAYWFQRSVQLQLILDIVVSDRCWSHEICCQTVQRANHRWDFIIQFKSANSIFSLTKSRKIHSLSHTKRIQTQSNCTKPDQWGVIIQFKSWFNPSLDSVHFSRSDQQFATSISVHLSFYCRNK